MNAKTQRGEERHRESIVLEEKRREEKRGTNN